ncbi:MAG: GIY-YIG nuclease family protein [Syntrophorhabdales bacterium]|jgi:putative endonuclease
MASPYKNEAWCVYVLRCRDNSYYIGSTNNLERRLSEHRRGTGSKYVKSRRPFDLARVVPCQTGPEARHVESRLKVLKRKGKEELLQIEHSVIRRISRLPKHVGLATPEDISRVINRVLTHGPDLPREADEESGVGSGRTGCASVPQEGEGKVDRAKQNSSPK